MFRTSSYTIFVDLPQHPAEVLLVHGYTGAFDKVSRPVATYLRRRAGRRLREEDLGGADSGVAAPSEKTLQVLMRRGYLTARSHEEEEELVCRLTEAFHSRALRRQPAYVFLPTYSCNLACGYCFQAHMRKDPAFGHLLRVMTPEMADRIFAALPALERRHGVPEGPRGQRSILFFGGEPLLAESRPVVEHIIRRARAEGEFSFSAISNGTELEAYEDLLGPDGIVFLQITLDGPPREHDQRRIYVDGSGSFARIARNITLALDRGVRVAVRINVDHTNAAMIPELAREAAERRWNTYTNFNLYATPVHESNDNTDGSAVMDSWVLTKMLRDLQQQQPVAGLVGRMDDSLLSRLRQIFAHQQDPTPGFKVSFCSAHSTMYLFDSFGDVYSCWEHTGATDKRTGHVTAEGEIVFDEAQEARWHGRTVATNPVCRRCRYAFYCGGGCASMAEHHNGEFFSSFCDGFSRRFGAAAAQAYTDFRAGRLAAAAHSEGCDQ